MPRGGKAKGKGKIETTKTSVVLDEDRKRKLFMLAQGLDAEMSDIVKRALDLFYEYTVMYAKKTNNRRLLKILELAEDKELWESKANLDDVFNFAKEEIKKKAD